MAFNDRGFPKVFNLPGSSGGETSGLYAAVTENDVAPMDPTYLDGNTPGAFDFGDAARYVGDILTLGGDAYAQYQQERARAQLAEQQRLLSTQPTLAAQWQTLTFYEKAGFAFALGGFAYLLVKR